MKAIFSIIYVFVLSLVTSALVSVCVNAAYQSPSSTTYLNNPSASSAEILQASVEANTTKYQNDLKNYQTKVFLTKVALAVIFLIIAVILYNRLLLVASGLLLSVPATSGLLSGLPFFNSSVTLPSSNLSNSITITTLVIFWLLALVAGWLLSNQDMKKV